MTSPQVPSAKEKNRVRSALRAAVNRGALLRPSTCERCGGSGGRIEGHHPDYSEPLEVLWLCGSCHGKEHTGPPRTGVEVLLSEYIVCKALLKKGMHKGEVCGHRWLPRKKDVWRCPGCQSFAFDREPEKVAK